MFFVLEMSKYYVIFQTKARLFVSKWGKMGQSGALFCTNCLFLYRYQAYDLYTLLVILIIFQFPDIFFSLHGAIFKIHT